MGSIDDTLRKMREAGKMQDMKRKGDLGEDAVIEICYQRRQKTGKGLLYSSYKYPYQSNRSGQCYLGNVFNENGVLKDYSRDTLDDEIDVLYITPYRIFPIEVKSYRSGTLELYDHWMNRNGQPVDKSPIMQAEKHARHLYHLICDVIPDGKWEYIKPMVCFVDKCTLKDDRSPYFQQYIPAFVLNRLLSKLNTYNTPLEYNLDLLAISEKLTKSCTSIKKTL